MLHKEFSIALVVPALSEGGGVPAVATFLYQLLSSTDRYKPILISLATSMRDTNSVRLLAPGSWLLGVQQTWAEWQDRPYRHVGAVLTEFEFQRYRPRQVLTNLLNQYDLVQIVAGTPAWALVAQKCQGVVTLQVATLTAVERAARLKRERGFRRFWTALMTQITTKLEHKALQRPSAIFVENTWMHRQLTADLDAQRVIFAPPGIDTNFFKAAVYHRDGYILSVGRFNDPRKNIRLLFDAYDRLRRMIPCAPRLVLAGVTAPSQENWLYAVSLGIADYIDIHCDVSSSQLRNLYCGASLFMLSSDEEGLGVVILEAMASGLPVISTRCGGPETAVADGVTGYLTPVGDAQALALRMAELIQDSELRRQMGQQGRLVAEQRFSLAAAGKVYLDKYDQLLGIGR